MVISMKHAWSRLIHFSFFHPHIDNYFPCAMMTEMPRSLTLSDRLCLYPSHNAFKFQRKPPHSSPLPPPPPFCSLFKACTTLTSLSFSHHLALLLNFPDQQGTSKIIADVLGDTFDSISTLHPCGENVVNPSARDGDKKKTFVHWLIMENI